MPAFTHNLPQHIWTILFVFMPFVFYSAIYEGSLLPKLVLLQIALIVLLILLLNKNKHPKLPAPITTSLLAYFLLHTLSFFQSINPIESILQLSQHLPFLFIPFLVISTLSPAQFSRILTIAPWSGFPIALLGIGQYLGWDIFDIPSNAQPSATFFHRNAAAAYIICIFPLAWIGFQCAQTRAKTLSHTILLLILGIFLIYTRTRAAWLGLVGSCIMVYISSMYIPSKNNPILQKSKHTLLCIITIIIGLSAWLPENIQGTRRIQFDEKKANAATTITSIFSEGGHRGRLDLWQHTISMVLHHPLGVGLGNWQYHYPHYARGNHINVKAAPERPHNDFLWIMAELGIVGLLTFLLIVALTIRTALPLLSHSSLEKRTQIQALLVLMGAYLIDGAFSFPRGQIVPSLFFWFALGGIALLANTQTPHRHLWHYPTKVITLTLLTLCLTITFKRIQYDIHHQRVHTAERNANWPQTIHSANQAIQIGTYRANTFIAQGRAYYRTGDLTSAETAYKIGLSLHPNSLNAYNNLGIVYRQQGKNELAIEAFQKALYLHPDFVEAYYNLGNVYTNLSQWDNALQAYQTAENKGLNMPQLYFKLGQVFYAKSHLKQAEQYFLKALKRDPNFIPAAQALKQITPSP